MKIQTIHTSVLLKEIVELLNPQPGDAVIDGTFGSGGHSRVILEKIKPTGRLLAIDWNEAAINKCHELNIECAQGNYANSVDIIRAHNFPKADVALLDLGFSSDEIETSGRGFSFQKNEPLLMTYSNDQVPVRTLLRQLSESALGDILKNLGEERFARPIAKAIKERQRKSAIETTGELVDVILKAIHSPKFLGKKFWQASRLHPATRTFMALRIYANNELGNLEKFLSNVPKVIAPGGRIGIISFHSLEDRAVKNYFRDFKKAGLGQLLTKKPLTPSTDEIISNPRARSAKLRVFKFNN